MRGRGRGRGGCPWYIPDRPQRDLTDPLRMADFKFPLSPALFGRLLNFQSPQDKRELAADLRKPNVTTLEQIFLTLAAVRVMLNSSYCQDQHATLQQDAEDLWRLMDGERAQVVSHQQQQQHHRQHQQQQQHHHQQQQQLQQQQQPGSGPSDPRVAVAGTGAGGDDLQAGDHSMQDDERPPTPGRNLPLLGASLLPVLPSSERLFDPLRPEDAASTAAGAMALAQELVSANLWLKKKA